MDDLYRFGQYVTPCDIPEGPPRGFRFDGDSCVFDLDLKTAAKHDWDYLVGRGKLASDIAYAMGYVRDQRPLRALGRFLGLSIGGHIFYHRNRRDRIERGVGAIIAERMIDRYDEDIWIWPVLTWKLEDLKLKPETEQ